METSLDLVFKDWLASNVCAKNLQEHCNIETMDWYNSLVSFSMPDDEDEDESFSDFEKDPDRKFLTLVVEKVLVVKMTAIISATYDAMSTTQTLKLTGTINR